MCPIEGIWGRWQVTAMQVWEKRPRVRAVESGAEQT